MNHLSIMIQYVVPIADIAAKFAYTNFTPEGFTGDPDVPIAKSIVDFIVRKFAAIEGRGPIRWIDAKTPEAVAAPGGAAAAEEASGEVTGVGDGATGPPGAFRGTGPRCGRCGAFMQRAGSCFSCSNCGQSSGCG